MYSSIPFARRVGSPFGDHQRIDRLAYRLLKTQASTVGFPAIKAILHFEGKHGPDGIKIKNPGFEPQHFYNPEHPEETNLLEAIQYHYVHLVRHLKDDNMEHAAFDASWLAHALVDGLTPAHHYPYEAEMEKLMGEGGAQRNTIAKKFYVKGTSAHDTIKRSWLLMGDKGLLSTHTLFEACLAMSLAGFRPKSDKLQLLHGKNLSILFMEHALAIAGLGMYERFYARGWTTTLALKTRYEVGPRMVEVVATAWYLALQEARATTKPKKR